MSNTNFPNLTNKSICNAIGCQKNTETNISITLGKRIVNLSFCEECAIKFQQNKV
jgi:hypothetical protein